MNRFHVEHVRIRLQVQATGPKVYSGPLDLIKKVYSNHGLSGIYKGQMITLVREFSGYGIYFAVYEYLVQKTMEQEKIKRNQVSSWKQLAFGALSGYALWVVIYPIVFYIDLRMPLNPNCKQMHLVLIVFLKAV